MSLNNGPTLRASTKKLLVATALSLLWLPLIFIPVDQLNQPLSTHDLLLAAPLILEFVGFYILHTFTQSRGEAYTKNERKYLLIMVIGFFVLLSVPVVINVLSTNESMGFKISIVLSLGYALGSIVANTKQISTSSHAIGAYFLKRFVLPVGIAIGTFWVATLIPNLALTINVLAVYYIAKNFISARAPEKA